jgi:hypothetical protein
VQSSKHTVSDEAGRSFRSEAGRRSDLMSVTGCFSQIEFGEVSDVIDGQVSAHFRMGRGFRRLSPARSMRCIVDDTIDNRVGERRGSDRLVPAVDWNLAGKDD